MSVSPFTEAVCAVVGCAAWAEGEIAQAAHALPGDLGLSYVACSDAGTRIARFGR